MSDRPQLIGIILCELILQDVLRRDAISCVNIHSGIMTQGFPTQLPLIYAFAQLTGIKKAFSYQFTVIDPTGKVVGSSPLTKVDEILQDNVTHKIINAFTGLTFEKEGTYDIVLVVDQQQAGALPFQVVLAPPPPAQQQPVTA